MARTTIPASVHEPEHRELHKQGMLIYQNELTTAVTDLDITGLSGRAHGGYVIELIPHNPTASFCIYRLFVEGNNTTTNYHTQFLFGTGTSATAGRAIAADVCAAGITSACKATISLSLAVYPTNQYWPVATVEEMRWNANVEHVTRSWAKADSPVSDITTIRISSNVANGLGVGTQVRIWRKT